MRRGDMKFRITHLFVVLTLASVVCLIGVRRYRQLQIQTLREKAEQSHLEWLSAVDAMNYPRFRQPTFVKELDSLSLEFSRGDYFDETSQ